MFYPRYHAGNPTLPPSVDGRSGMALQQGETTTPVHSCAGEATMERQLHPGPEEECLGRGGWHREEHPEL
jgi:hypothetical protein